MAPVPPQPLGVAFARWLPPCAWQDMAEEYEPRRVPLTLGVDIGGSRSASALVGVAMADERVSVELVEVRQGRGAVLEVAQRIRELAAEGRVERIVLDPMRFESEALRLEQELGLQVNESPQSEVRLTRSSENLHRLIVEGRLRHFNHPELNKHVAQGHREAHTARLATLQGRRERSDLTPSSRWRAPPRSARRRRRP
jgi:hypothetical protein